MSEGKVGRVSERELKGIHKHEGRERSASAESRENDGWESGQS